jgi:hypothetical protein
LSELSTEELEKLLADGDQDSDAPESTEAQATSEGGEKIPKQRLRPKNDKDQQVLDLYKSEGFEGSFQDATKVIYGDNTPAKEQPKEADAPPVDPEASKVEELRNEVIALTQEADQLAEEMETSKALAKQREIQKRELEILKLEQKRENEKSTQRQAELDQFRMSERASQDRVFQQFPVLADQNSTERKQFESWVQEKQNDPEYAPVFQSPKWTELLVGEFADKHLPKPVEANTAPPAQNRARLLTSANNSNTNSNQPKVTADQIRQNIDNLDRDTLFKLLG